MEFPNPVQGMPCAFDDCENDGEFFGVTKWHVPLEGEPRIKDVATCELHTLCPVCEIPMEENPISGGIECFIHGVPKPTSIHA